LENLEMREKDFGKKISILSFDIEEWFHILNVDSLEKDNKWASYEVRIYENTNRILEVLHKNNLKATFFILGWIAKKYPDLIRLISDQGHEIGTHSLNHLLIYKIEPELFRRDLRQSIDIIQDLIQKKVRTFRAPGFSIKKETFWALRFWQKKA
jgi:peptidoglycan/xylan/chitin deacetylase (PgdA/CDA1 family)